MNYFLCKNHPYAISRIIILFYIVILLLPLTGCRNNPYILSELSRADTLLNTHPDSALKIIRNINYNEIRNPAVRAKHSLLHSMALDKTYTDLTNDSIIRFALQYYNRKGNILQKAKSNFYMGRICCNATDKDGAVKYLTEAESHAVKTKDYYLCGLIYNTLGNLYYYQEDLREAIPMYEKSGFFFGKAGDLRKKANAFSYVGKIYRMLNDFSRAVYFYQKAKDIYILLNRGNNVLAMNRSIAESMLHKGHEAIAILTEGYALYNHHRILERDYPLWARIYLNLNNLKEARKFALLAMKYEYVTERVKAGLYVILSEISFRSGNFRDAYAYSDLYSEQISAAYQKEKEELIQGIQEKYNKEKLKISYIALRKEHKYQTIIYSLVLILGLVVGFFMIIRQIGKRKRMQENFERELNESEVYLEAMKENFSMLSRKYKTMKAESDKQDERAGKFFNAFEQRLVLMKNIMDIAYTTESNPKHFYKKFLEYISAGTKAADAFGDLQYVVNEKYSGIIDHVKEKYPLLSKTDLDFFSMLCFNFTPNAIRLIYGHTNLDSVFTKRKKLRDKLNVPASMQIETFIKKLKIELAGKNTYKLL